MKSLHGALRSIYNRWFRPDPLADLLRQGLVVGANFKMMPGVSVDWSHCWHIVIGDDVTLAPGVRVLAHDASTKAPLGYTRIAKVRIGDRTFIGSNSVVLPGVSIGSDVIIGAGSIVARDLPDGVVAVGNPAVVVSTTAEWLERRRAELGQVPVFGPEYTIAGNVSAAMKAEMNELMGDGIGYII